MKYERMVSDLAKIKAELSSDPTATFTAHLLMGVRNFLIDIDESFSVQDFKNMSIEEIIRLSMKGKMK